MSEEIEVPEGQPTQFVGHRFREPRILEFYSITWGEMKVFNIKVLDAVLKAQEPTEGDAMLEFFKGKS